MSGNTYKGVGPNRLPHLTDLDFVRAWYTDTPLMVLCDELQCSTTALVARWNWLRSRGDLPEGPRRHVQTRSLSPPGPEPIPDHFDGRPSVDRPGRDDPLLAALEREHPEKAPR